MIPQIDDKTLLLLNLLLPGFNPVEGSKFTGSHSCRLDLPSADGADYFFRLWFYSDGERQIGAQPVEDSDDARYFWYRPFELAQFTESKDDLVNAFCRELEALITHETRITQRKGWLLALPLRLPRIGELEVPVQAFRSSWRIQTTPDKRPKESL